MQSVYRDKIRDPCTVLVFYEVGEETPRIPGPRPVRNQVHKVSIHVLMFTFCG